MDQETSNIFHRFWKWRQTNCDDGDQTGSKRRLDKFTSESRILDIQRAEMAKKAALTHHAQRLCAAAKARDDAVLKRLGLPVQHVAPPSPHPPIFPKRSAKSPQQNFRFRPVLEEPSLNMEDTSRTQRSSESLDEEEESYDSFLEMLLGNQTESRAQQLPATLSTLSSTHSFTVRGLRAIPLSESPVEVPTPLPPPQAVPLSRRRMSHLPVFSTKPSGAVAANRAPVLPHLSPTLPTFSQTIRRRTGMYLWPAKAVGGAAPL
uniref:uncharacterized protein LOC124066528 n=1 Tax=Scatophagus argus TaxID=75038 RepID=UPI001ED822E7|nr:uncharacterized protein LOC124066528 [Scatophagus argus]